MPSLHTLVALPLALGLAFSFTGCRSPSTAEPSSASRTAIEKPWTKEAIESHEYLWLELSTGKRGVMTGPVLEKDANGEFLTTKTDPTVHLALADVTVMDAVDVTQPAPPVSTAITIAGSFAALWTAVLFFLPAIAVYLLVA